jgi:hypothetical protein
MENKSIASKEYQIWWEKNSERILAEDKLNHEMNFKSALAKSMKGTKLVK